MAHNLTGPGNRVRGVEPRADEIPHGLVILLLATCAWVPMALIAAGVWRLVLTSLG